MTLLGSLTLLNPWFLGALVLLPALWWLLKVTPPAAKRHRFPAIRLLADLETEDRTAAHTPLWLAILRLVLAALVILALAHPMLRPAARFAASGPLLLAIDNGWAAGPDWTVRQNAALDILARAEGEGREAALLTTAPPESGDAASVRGPLPAGEARRIVQALRPNPWPTDRIAAAGALARFLEAGDGRKVPATAIWISDDVDDAEKSA
ncbi:MAG: BatA domain-containing protein, partial [Alphaproteobacteria bacterium]